MTYNFVYKTTNNLNGDYYYGVHSTNNLDDGYLGSGKRLNYAINKYGKSNFIREIVQYFSDIKNAYILEAAIVTPELVNDPHCYNLVCGGLGGQVGERNQFFGKHHKKESREKISNGNKNKPKSEEHKAKLRKPKSEEHKAKLRKPKSEEHKQKLKGPRPSLQGKNNPMYGKNAEDYMTHEAIQKKRRKQSEGIKNYYKDPLHRAKCGDSTRGKKCINNGYINKLVKREELDLFLSNGWKLGRK